MQILGRIAKILEKKPEFEGKKICIQRYNFSAKMIIDTGSYDNQGKKILNRYQYSEAIQQFQADFNSEISDISSICSKVYRNEDLCKVGFLSAYQTQ